MLVATIKQFLFFLLREAGIPIFAYLVEYAVYLLFRGFLPGIVVPVGVAACLIATGILARVFLPVLAQLLDNGRAAVAAEIAVFWMTAPVFDEQETEEHTAKVGEMGHVARGEECREHLDGDIDGDEPLGLDGDGKGEDEDALLRERHAECQKDGIDGARGSHRGP